MEENLGVKRANRKDVHADNISEELQKSLIEQALQNMFKPGEIDYTLSMAKKKSLSSEQISETFHRALDTLEILMCKLGLNDSFAKIRD